MATAGDSRQVGPVHPKSIVGWMGVLLAVCGCVATPGRKLTWRTLSRGLTSGLTEARRDVVRDEVSFLKLWAEHSAELNRPALPPTVDFQKDMVVVVAMGGRPTGGFLTEIVDVELRGKTLNVLVGEKSPLPGSVQVQIATQPYVMVALPAIAGRVEFRTVREATRPRKRREAGEATERPSSQATGSSAEPVRSPRGSVR